ncbi:MAG TPA: nucleoside triphosphate pyrophosphohydrolase [Acidimicrobiales bacterium]
MTGGRVTVIGLGPAGPELVTIQARAAIDRIPTRFVRTARHPSAGLVLDAESGAVAFDELYDRSDRIEEVYRGIVERLLGAAAEHGEVLYAVPGSPLVAEHTVELLRASAPAVGVTVEVLPALSYLDLAWAALGVDPLAAGVRLVDGHRFVVEAAGERGPLLVAQCDRSSVLSDMKLAIDPFPEHPVTVLQRLGLPNQSVTTVEWAELDRSFAPDHLTTLWIPELASPVGAELVRFHELVRTLREQCPWDREQTHHTLTKHLLEEAYEVLEAIEAHDPGDADADAALEEELGDLLFQVEFHAVIAEQDGRFNMADVARGIHDKLVRRHPHVFGTVDAATSDQVLANWEQIKRDEKGHASIMEGVPGNLPALLYAAKVQKKAAGVGFDWPDGTGALPKIAEEAAELGEVLHDHDAAFEELGDLLFAVVNVARHAKVDAESALRAATAKFRRRFQAVETLVAERGLDMRTMDLASLDALWDEVKSTEPRR